MILTYLILLLAVSCAFSFRFFPTPLLRNRTPCYATVVKEEVTTEEAVITITEQARNHLRTMIKDKSSLYLRMGVKSGGCSGMSYAMDIIDPSAMTEDDHIEKFEDITCVIDPKSLLYLYGLRLDYSNELIGGGFKFSNPNAETSCGCGKSFGV